MKYFEDLVANSYSLNNSLTIQLTLYNKFAISYTTITVKLPKFLDNVWENGKNNPFMNELQIVLLLSKYR